MRSLVVFLIILVALASCKTGWTVEEQTQFKNDCITMSQNVEGAEQICDCGLEKAMEKYDSKQAAEQAIQKMNEDELKRLFAECM